MVRLLVCAVALAGSSRPVAAALPAGFDSVLAGIRSTALQARQDQKAVRALATAAEIDRASFDARDLAWRADQLRWKVSDIRRRARFADRRPGRPNNDPFFESDLRRLVWDLRDHRQRSEQAGRDVERLERSASSDPTLAAPAQRLADQSRGLLSSAGWLRSEGGWARMDLSSAGYNFEAWDVERETRDAEDSARNLERDARSLLEKVRQPQAP